MAGLPERPDPNDDRLIDMRWGGPSLFPHQELAAVSATITARLSAEEWNLDYGRPYNGPIGALQELAKFLSTSCANDGDGTSSL